MHASVVYMPTCQRANMPKAYQRLFFMYQRANKRPNVPTCQRRANFSTWRINVPKGMSIFQLFFKKNFQFSDFSVMLNICKLQEYLDNSRKFISQNKEFKSLHLQNLINKMEN